jgi:hypothetical protein
MTQRREHFYLIRPSVAYQPERDPLLLELNRPKDTLADARAVALRGAQTTGKDALVYEVRLVGSYGPPSPVWRKAARTTKRRSKRK